MINPLASENGDTHPEDRAEAAHGSHGVASSKPSKKTVVTGPTSLRSLVTTVGEKAVARKEAAAKKKSWSMGWKPPKKADDASAHHPAGTPSAGPTNPEPNHPDPSAQDVSPADPASASLDSVVASSASYPFQSPGDGSSPTLRLAPTSPFAQFEAPTSSVAVDAPVSERAESPGRSRSGRAGWVAAATIGVAWRAWSNLGPRTTPGTPTATGEPSSPRLLARPLAPLPGAITETAFVTLQQQHARLEHRLEAWQAAAEVDVVPAEEFALERRRHLVAYDRLAELDAFVVDQDRVIETLRDQVSHLRRVLAGRSVTLDAIAARD